MTLYYKQNPSLLKAMREIFGNVVEKAYLASSDESALATHQKFFVEELKKTKNEIFVWSGECIVIEFRNGRRVTMRNTEWASFETDAKDGSMIEVS